MNALYKHLEEVKSREKKTLFKLKGIIGKETNGYRLAINSFRMKTKLCLTIGALRLKSQVLRGV